MKRGNQGARGIMEFVAKYEKEYYKFFADKIRKTLGVEMYISEDGRGFACADDETHEKIRMLIPLIEMEFAAKIQREHK